MGQKEKAGRWQGLGGASVTLMIDHGRLPLLEAVFKLAENGYFDAGPCTPYPWSLDLQAYRSWQARRCAHACVGC